MESPFAPPLVLEELPPVSSVESLGERLCGVPAPFLLESGLSVGGMGKWHILGGYPVGEALVRGLCWRVELGGVSRQGRSDPVHAVEEWWQQWARPREDAQGRFPFLGGAVGYLGYEWGDHLEKLPPRQPGFEDLPDLHLRLYDEVVLVECASGRCFYLHRGRTGGAARRWWQREPAPREALRPVRKHTRSIEDAAYLEAVEKIRAAIGQGDVYEVNLTRCHRIEGGPSAWELHRRLRRLQPVPYAALLPWEPLAVISASPERFLRRVGTQVETRPIKGTQARGADAKQDRAAAAQLLASAKERAELAMIVDLERNDLGRVCLPGSVQVVEEAAVEYYSTVIHTVATVRGELPEGFSPFALLKATFPGGSITGAPKIAAMKMIRELEPCPRKVYTGAMGWIGSSGDLDLSVAIRTIQRFGDTLLFSVGGAVTWDSDPQAELAELEAKGQAVFQALGVE